MKSPRFHALYVHARNAINSLQHGSFPGLSRDDLHAILVAGLEAIYIRLLELESAEESVTLAEHQLADVDSARLIIMTCIAGYPPTKENMQRAVDHLTNCLVSGGKGGAK